MTQASVDSLLAVVLQLPRDRLQLQVTQPGSDMKVLQEIDSAGVELHLWDHGISGPGLHNIWVILRPLPLSPVEGRPPATLAHGSPGDHCHDPFVLKLSASNVHGGLSIRWNQAWP